MVPLSKRSPPAGGVRLRGLERYAVAVLMAAGAVVLHVALHRRFGSSADPILLIIVVFSTWFGGFGAGVVTLVFLGLGAFATTVRPIGAPMVATGGDALALTVYGVTGLMLSALIASLLGARRRSDRAAARTARLPLRRSGARSRAGRG